MTRILIAEDDRSFADSVKEWLQRENYVVDVANDGERAFQLLKEVRYDVLILDVNLPYANGFDICGRYRSEGGTGRILMLTGRNSFTDKEAGFGQGADDYLTKPCDLRELSIRIKALLRRSLSMIGQEIIAGELVVNPALHEAKLNGNIVRLLPQEYALIEFMARQPNRIFSTEEIIQEVWHGNSSIDTVRTHIKTIRRKLKSKNGRELIRTVHGVGYCLDIRQEDS